MTTFIRGILQKEFPESQKIHAKTIRKSIFVFIHKDYVKFIHRYYEAIGK